MVKFLVIYEQPTNPAEFVRHYFDVHIPLAKQLPGLRSYSVSRNLKPVRGELPHMVGELQWDDLLSLQRDFASELGRKCAADVDTLAKMCGGVRSVIFESETV
jgi:uncharacterized protein (TIGR02118 family)